MSKRFMKTLVVSFIFTCLLALSTVSRITFELAYICIVGLAADNLINCFEENREKKDEV